MDLVAAVHIFGFLLSGMALGAMLFFAAVVTPLVFRNLPSDIAGDFLRGMFPVYYAVLMAVTGIAALCLWPWPEAVLVAAVALLFAFAKWGLRPRIGRARDLSLLGDAEETKVFRRLHRLSVIIAVAQMLALLTVLLRLVTI